jgi:hypothetical protein
MPDIITTRVRFHWVVWWALLGAGCNPAEPRDATADAAAVPTDVRPATDASGVDANGSSDARAVDANVSSDARAVDANVNSDARASDASVGSDARVGGRRLRLLRAVVRVEGADDAHALQGRIGTRIEGRSPTYQLKGVLR